MNLRGPYPWQLSFSTGARSRPAALHTWVGKPENVEAAQAAYHHRAELNGAARNGRYTPELEAS